MLTDALLRTILKRDRIIAVVGLSDQSHRPSHRVAAYMQSCGYRIVPVNPLLAAAGRTVLGECYYSSLAAAQTALLAAGTSIEMVNVFRRSEEVRHIAADAIAIGARSLWLQLGVCDETAAMQARAAGLDVVMDRCVKIEHARLSSSFDE